jgi:hypothetical protein
MDAMQWLAPRLEDVPMSLRARLEGAVRAHAPAGPPAQALLSAGQALLAQAKDAPPTRDTALVLLAADALVTFSCEAAAEQ